MTTTTKTEAPTDATNLVDDARAAAEHAEASSLAVIRPEQQRFDENQKAILRQLGIEDATDGDLDLFFHVCRTTGLDPFRKQIYMIGRNTKVTEWVDDQRGQNGRRKVEKWVTKYTIQTGIDGYRRNVREAAKTLGDEIRLLGPFFTGENDFKVTDDGEVIQLWRKVWPEKRPPHAARFVIIRNGEEFEGIAHFDEFVQTGYGDEPNSMWRKMPRNQIAKCAEALAYRRAYPDDLSGLILEDASQPTVIDGETGEIIREGRPAQRQRAAKVTVDEIFAEEVPLSSEDPDNPGDNPRSAAEQATAAPRNEHYVEAALSTATAFPEPPAGDVTEDQGNGATDPEPSPAAQPEPATSNAGAEPEPEQVKAPAKKAPAKKATPKRDPSKPKSKLRAPLEKRLFALLGDAGMTGDKDRDGRIAVYRAITGNPEIMSTDDLDDVTVGKVCDQLYRWQTENELDEQIADILSDAAREAEETSAAPAADPTTEGAE